MNVPDLRYIVKTTIVKYLVCSNDISRDHLVMLEYFRSCGQGVFGDEILSQIIGDFPSQLTDELLIVLSPPHQRHLKLTKCSALSCSGLQMAITKCQQLQALDFSECIHLLHPTVFCCIKEKATNLVSLSLENSEVVSDDIVQVALMCCPGLKHLNLSLCKNITDAAFALENTVSRTASASHTLQPGHNLTSVDISGCQSLSTMAVKYLVDICGANLTNVNLAWTGMNCTALLYLAGLNVANVARLMHEADHASVDSALPSMVAKEELPNHDNWCDGIHDFTNQGFSDSNLTGVVPLMPAGNTYGFNDSQLNEMEVLTLKDVLDHVLVTCEPAKSQSSEGIPCLQELDESRDEVLKSDNFLLTCSLLSVEATHNPISQQENSSHEHLLQTEQKETCVHGHGDCTCVMKKAADRTLCWNAPTGDEPLKESRTKINTQDESITSGLDETASDKREHDIEHNHTKTTVQKCNGGFEVEEIHEDEFDTESHPVSKTGDQFISCTQEKSCLKSECNNLSMPCTEVNGKKPEFPTIVCEEVKDDESTCNCRSIHGAAVKCEKSDHPFVSSAAVKCEKSDHPIVPSAGVECEKSDHSIVPSAGVECKKSDHPIVPSAGVECEKCVCPIMPCVELQVMDEEVECEDPRIHCRVDEGEKPVFPITPSVKEMDHDCSFPTMPCIVHESKESSTCSIMHQKDGKGKEFDCSITTCWEDKGVLPDSSLHMACEEENGQSKHSEGVGACNINLLDYVSSHSRVIQITDLLEAQTFQPQITSLDITDLCYQSKPLGQACLKIFSQANKCLKNFALSWSDLDDGMLTYLLKNEHELESLSLVDCEKLSNLSLSCIPVHCPKLTSFDLKGMCYVTDHGLMPLTRSNHLQSLSLAEADITDCTLESIAKGCGAKLKVLDVSWCEDITDQGMSVVAECCRSLQHLGLRQCAASRLTLNALTDSCHLVSSLNIAGIKDLTDAALGSLAENMPFLREIDASWNSCLSDTGINALLQYCNKLKKVVLCGLKLITSQPFVGIIGDLNRWRLLEELWRYNRTLQSSSTPQRKFALKSCNSETAKSLGDEIPFRSMSYAPSLRHMELHYSDKVNDDHLAAIVAVCRGTLFIEDYYCQPVEPKWIFRSV